MWMFTTRGFYSVIEKGRLMQIRARNRQDLENLNLSNRIIETPDADYMYRIVVSRKTWKKVAALLAQDIDYPNFKNACDPERQPLYLEVWRLMRRLG